MNFYNVEVQQMGVAKMGAERAGPQDGHKGILMTTKKAC